MVSGAVAEVGLEPELVDAMNDAAYDEAVVRSHHEGMDQVGDDVGTPTISVNGAAFFELKRTRSGELDFG